ncbi:hypothetical protein jhhlp_000439 [Lomentospora prolificans]|uniref:Uncharacterized protein n=1 Tax=Lomentospora prolificans TaxID=41688 RepID=A0A2N3NL14_9PEZI|nr:hypothetical protein jhhlp_000439 [Lomentospora prolificans]
MSQQPKSKGKQRNPPPSLFLHPSPSASHVTLPGILVPGAPAPASARTVALASQTTAQRSATPASGSLVPSISGRPIRGLKTGDSTRSGDRTDALWAEMQATLEEVELSASGGTHVFGPDHDRKLAELRAAQITLAQAWARSEADEVIETVKETGRAAGTEELRKLKGTGLVDSAKAGGEGADTFKTAGSNSAARPGSSGAGVERLEAKLEEETEVDILLARKRREANDQYFQRVNQGVLDVVAKLGEVAVAMKAVEQESKDIWGETESRPSTAKS